MTLTNIESIFAIIDSIAAIVFGISTIYYYRRSQRLSEKVYTLQEEENATNNKHYILSQSQALEPYASAIDLQYTTNHETSVMSVKYDESKFNSVDIEEKSVLMITIFIEDDPRNQRSQTLIKVPIRLCYYRGQITKKADINNSTLEYRYPRNQAILSHTMSQINISLRHSYELVDFAKLTYISKSGLRNTNYYVNGIFSEKDRYLAILRSYSNPTMPDFNQDLFQFPGLEHGPEKIISIIKKVARKSLIEKTTHYLKDAPILYKLVRRTHFSTVKRNLSRLLESDTPYQLLFSISIREDPNEQSIRNTESQLLTSSTQESNHVQ